MPPDYLPEGKARGSDFPRRLALDSPGRNAAWQRGNTNRRLAFHHERQSCTIAVLFLDPISDTQAESGHP